MYVLCVGLVTVEKALNLLVLELRMVMSPSECGEAELVLCKSSQPFNL